MAVRNVGVGESVEVEGGHIVRSTSPKDCHSKVCTAKGPRDQRVRLSAYTAIKFYDVQDRLYYDQPSKAVDWLIKSPPLTSSSNSLYGGPLQQTLTRLHSRCLMMGGEVLLEVAMKED